MRRRRQRRSPFETGAIENLRENFFDGYAVWKRRNRSELLFAGRVGKHAKPWIAIMATATFLGYIGYSIVEVTKPSSRATIGTKAPQIAPLQPAGFRIVSLILAQTQKSGPAIT